jgi:hypothetical protein
MTRPRSLLARPMPLVAIAVLVVNDHWAKAAHPGVVTGKLSDFAGMVFFPVLVVAAIELVLGRPWRSRAVLVSVAAVCLAVFAAMKLSPAAGDLYASVLGHAQWPPRAAAAALAGESIPPAVAVAHTLDPTDLVAALAGAVLCIVSTGRLAPRRSAAARRITRARPGPHRAACRTWSRPCRSCRTG